MADVVKVKRRRNLAEIMIEAVQHEDTHPSHGFNCTCMDALLREMSDQIRLVQKVYPGRERFNRMYYLMSVTTRNM